METTNPGRIADLLGRPVLVLDTETSGLDPTTNYVIELGAILYDSSGSEKRRLSTVIRLPDGVTLPPKITEITGITPDQVAAGIDRGVAMARLEEMMSFPLDTEPPVLVAHNAPFDLAFVKAEMQRVYAHVHMDHDFIDTLSLARLVDLPYPHKLANVAENLGIKFEGEAHRAMNDLLTTAHVAARLYELSLERKRPIVNAICFNPKYPLPPRPHDRTIYYQWFAQKGA